MIRKFDAHNRRGLKAKRDRDENNTLPLPSEFEKVGGVRKLRVITKDTIHYGEENVESHDRLPPEETRHIEDVRMNCRTPFMSGYSFMPYSHAC